MPFQLKVYTAKSFLLKLEEFRLRRVDDFGGDIDIESYLFFKTVIYQKAPRIITDLLQEEITSFKEMATDKIAGHEKKDIIRLIQAVKNKMICSDEGLIQKLKSKENVPYESLPHYLFLGDVSEHDCRDIESAYGIYCYSTKRLKVKENSRQVSLSKLKNTKGELYHKLSYPIFNSIHINDPYFYINADNPKNRQTIEDGISQLLTRNENFKPSLDVKVSSVLNPGREEINTNEDFDTWATQFRRQLERVCRLTVFEATAVAKNSFHKTIADPKEDKHDRYIFTNRSINIIGNSFFTNKRTHFTSYPIGIYCNFFD